MMLLSIDFENLHQILRSLYQDMMPLCSQMTGVAKGIAGLGALFYVAYRVWQSLSRAEPVDVYPLLRPFVLGFCIMFFPSVVLGTINNVLSPVVKGTNNILQTQTFDMNEYREQKDRLEYEAMKRNPEMAYLVDKEEFDKRLEELGVLDAIEVCGMYIDRAMYNMKRSVQAFFRELLELMFQAAALVIDTIRTFFLIALSILGPISFAISVWDGFHASLTQWFVRYISIYLWLPVSDLFSGVYHIPHHRHHRVFHDTHRCELDRAGRRRRRKLRQECQPGSGTYGLRGGGNGWCGHRQHRWQAD